MSSLLTDILEEFKVQLTAITPDEEVPPTSIFVRAVAEFSPERDSPSRGTAVIISETPGSTPITKRRIAGVTRDITFFVTVVLAGPQNRKLKNAEDIAATPDWRHQWREALILALHGKRLAAVPSVQRVFYEQAPLDLTQYELANLWQYNASFRVLCRIPQT